VSYRAAFFVTASLLAGALGYIVTRLPAELAATTPSASAEPSAPAPDNSAEMTRLRAKLSKCQDQSWEMAADLMKGSALPPPVTAPPVQRAARSLCPVSQAFMRQHWQQGKPVVAAILAKELGTPEWIERDTEARLMRHRDRFDLAARDEAALERGYRGLWHRHGEAMRDKAAAGDWQGAAATARAFWRDEDTMVAEVLRADELPRFTKEEAQARTTLLAVFATYGDQEWDDDALGLDGPQ
jgi:hypothetical protein